jgi:hypothetical protein
MLVCPLGKLKDDASSLGRARWMALFSTP